jgi:hypothetical protein
MTTPAQNAPTLTIATDKTTYLVGDTITLTATYADAQAQATPLVITATGTDAQGNTVTATATVSVSVQATENMTVTATDTSQDVYALVSNDGKGTAVLTTTAVAPPAAPSA